jgi:hypothetical protein
LAGGQLDLCAARWIGALAQGLTQSITRLRQAFTGGLSAVHGALAARSMALSARICARICSKTRGGPFLRAFDQAGHSASFDQSKEKAGNGQNQKDKEQCLGNTDRTGGNAAKAKQGGNQGDDKKYNGVVQHGGSW